MAGPVGGLTRQMWLKAEAAYNTFAKFAATDAIDLIKLDLTPDVKINTRQSHVGTASVQGFILESQENKWALESYIAPGAAGVAPDIGPLLDHAFGKAGAVVAGTSVTYDLADAQPTVGLQLSVNAGLGGEILEVANGAWCEQLSIECQSGEEPKISASGGFASYGMCLQGATTTGIEAAGQTAISCAAGTSRCLRPNAVVKFGAETNTGAGYTVTAVDTATDTITITPALAGEVASLTPITPLVLAGTRTGTPVAGVAGSVSIGGAAMEFLKVKIDINTGIKPITSGTSDVPTKLVLAERVITGEIELVEQAENTIKTAMGWTGTAQAIIVRLGPNTAASKYTITIPSALCKVVKRAYADGEATKITVAFLAKQSAAAADEMSTIFN
jgi:hypothetical protein